MKTTGQPNIARGVDFDPRAPRLLVINTYSNTHSKLLASWIEPAPVFNIIAARKDTKNLIYIYIYYIYIYIL